MAYQYSTTPLYVSEGDILQFKYQAPPFWDYTETITITIGGLTQYWLITTVPEDFAPDPYPLTDVIDADLTTYYFIDVIFNSPAGPSNVVTGLTPTTQAGLSLSANVLPDVNVYAVSVNGGPFELPSPTATVQNGDSLRLRALSSALPAKPLVVTLGIGTSFDFWTITTKPIPLNAPEPFPDFTDVTAVPVNSTVYSNIIRIQGLNDPATVQADNGALVGISNTNTTTVNADGYAVLSGVTFASSGTITNGQYLQLSVQSSATAFTPKTVALSVGDISAGSDWIVTTGANLSQTPTSFLFPDVTNAIEDSLIASAARPVGGITGLGPGVSVPVELVSTTSTEVKVKINNGSIGVFPASVVNGDTITLYIRSSATFGANVSATIKVGTLEIPTWTVQTNTGPDTDASFTPPSNLTNRVPNTYISSSAVIVGGINRPITISATNGALISIDYDTPVAGPRTFDPLVNTSFYLVLLSSTSLNTAVSTTVTVGTGTASNPFTWSVTTYAVAPLPPQYVSSWYSKKNEKIVRDISGTITSVKKTKYDGYAVGTILNILKEGPAGYGDIQDRFPGFLECDGTTYNVSDYPLLWEVIGNTYGGSGSYNSTTKAYSGTFSVPDYRNRRLCGTGNVDGNRGSSSFLPITSGGSVFSVGEIGGYWYVDTVGVSGPLPYDQVYGSGTTGTESPFFTLGTVKTTGASLVTTEVPFTITGSITGQIGPVSSVTVNVPTHSHLMISAVVDGESGDPLIPWGSRALYGTAAGPVSATFGEYPDEQEATWGPPLWRNWIGGLYGAFSGEVSATGVDTFINLSQIVAGAAAPSNVDYGNFWPSPYSGLDISKLTVNSNDAGGGRIVAGVIDTNPAKFRIDDYLSLSGTTEAHSHLLTTSSIADPQTDYTYGNASGAGTKNGLGDAANVINVTFQQNTVQLGLNEGTFTLNSGAKTPIPEVALSPNRTVPILTPFHKVKYIIKAY